MFRPEIQSHSREPVRAGFARVLTMALRRTSQTAKRPRMSWGRYGHARRLAGDKRPEGRAHRLRRSEVTGG